MYSDSHIHLYDYLLTSGNTPILEEGNLVCASAHDREGFLWQENFAAEHPGRVSLSFGIHPQLPSADMAEFLYSLVLGRRIQAIGECGFDLYTAVHRQREKEQKEVWSFQLDLAVSSSLPLIIHSRKAMHLVFADIRRLKKVRSVVFHGWAGTLVEAESLLSRGVNAFFSAGKGLLRGDRSLTETVLGIPLSRLLTETDAPYMKLKGEAHSSPSDIIAVAATAAAIRKVPVDVLSESLCRNFMLVFSGQSGQL
jgi:TatD DNase family protein